MGRGHWAWARGNKPRQVNKRIRDRDHELKGPEGQRGGKSWVRGQGRARRRRGAIVEGGQFNEGIRVERKRRQGSTNFGELKSARANFRQQGSGGGGGGGQGLHKSGSRAY